MNKAKVRPDGGSLMRVVRMFFRYYPVLAPLVVFCILFAAVVSSIPSLFIQRVIALIQVWVESGDWSSARAELMPYLMLLGGLYLLSIIALTAQTQFLLNRLTTTTPTAPAA